MFKYQHLIIVAILFLSLMMRFNYLSAFNYQFNATDFYRDYLVGHHIVEYKEFPLVGPPGNGKLIQSPFYYYLIAAFLLIQDNIAFLVMLNILFQIINVYLVYLLGREIFGERSGLIGAALFGFSYIIFTQSVYMWQPYLAQPIFHLSLLFFLFFYRKKKLPYLLSSVSLFITAIVIHNPYLALMPPFLILSFLALKKNDSGLLNYFFTAATFLFLLLIFYLPPIKELGISDNNPIGYMIFKFSNALEGYSLFVNLTDRVKSFWSYIFIRHSLISVILTFGIFVTYFLQKSEGQSRRYARVLIVIMAYFLIVAGSFDAGIMPFPQRYFIPILGIFFILLGEMIGGLWNKNKSHVVFCIGLATLFWFFMFDFKSQRFSMPIDGFAYLTAVVSNNKTEYKKVFPQNNLVKVVEDEVETIKTAESFGDIDFFQFDSYLYDFKHPTLDVLFWVPLEKHFGRSFTEVYDHDLYFRGYRTTNNDNYIFLICDFPDSIYNDKKCFNKFLNEHRAHKYVKTLVDGQSPYSIFVFKK